MIILVMGGSGSGKSEFAEQCCMQLKAKNRYYLATMQVFDEESRSRVARHRRMRSDKGFQTIEQPTHLEQVDLLPDSTVLLECLSNLAANEMFDPQGRGSESDQVIAAGLRRLAGQVRHLVIVSADIFADGVEYDAQTKAYQRLLAKLNAAAAELADEVYEVVCKIPICVKKRECMVNDMGCSKAF